MQSFHQIGCLNCSSRHVKKKHLTTGEGTFAEFQLVVWMVEPEQRKSLVGSSCPQVRLKWSCTCCCGEPVLLPGLCNTCRDRITESLRLEKPPKIESSS